MKMNIVNGEFRIDISIDSYEFPYHETNEYHDNNWLNVKAICEDDVVMDEGIEPCLLTSELVDLYHGLSKVLKKQSYHSNFLEPNLKIDVEVKEEQIIFSISFQRKQKEQFHVEAVYSMKQLDELINDVKAMVDNYPIREKKMYN